jgi:hypothetical protein
MKIFRMVIESDCETSAAARILSKELIAQNLIGLCELENLETRLQQKRQYVDVEHNLQEEVKGDEKAEFESIFDQEINNIPYFKQALEFQGQPPAQNKNDPMMNSMIQPSPGQARVKIEKNPNAHLVQQQTGVSITNGNYLNVGKNDISNRIPTYLQKS